MLWVPLTLGSALAEAALTVERKRLVTGASAYQLALIQTAMSAVVFGSLLPLTWRGSLSLDIITLIFVRSVSDACATVLMFVAMERDDASRIMPITALTPLFIVGLELAWSGRHPTSAGLLGVVLVTLGVFALLRGTRMESGKRISPGMLPILGVTVCWSLSGTIHGIVTPVIGPMYYLGLSETLIFFLLVVFGIASGRTTFAGIAQLPFRKNFSLGMFATTSQVMQMFAQSFTLASYVIALKRSSLAFGMIGSALFLKEKIARRVLPTLLLCAGAALIILFG